MTQVNGEKLDKTYPDGVGKPGGEGESTPTPKTEYGYAEKMAPHFAEIADSARDTAMYGGHGIEARKAGINVPSDADSDGDYDTPRTK